MLKERLSTQEGKLGIVAQITQSMTQMELDRHIQVAQRFWDTYNIVPLGPFGYLKEIVVWYNRDGVKFWEYIYFQKKHFNFSIIYDNGNKYPSHWKEVKFDIHKKLKTSQLKCITWRFDREQNNWSVK